MPQLKEMLEEKVANINKDEVRKGRLKEWINGYVGKVIGFKTPTDSYHIVLTEEGASLKQGDYPSCEYSYRGDDETLLSILRGEDTASSAVRAGKIKVWGSLNEAQRFEEIFI